MIWIKKDRDPLARALSSTSFVVMDRRLVCSMLALALLVAPVLRVRAQPTSDTRRWSVGTSAWMLANLLPDSPQFYYLEVDRRLGERDALVLEAITWRYHGPIGIPYWSPSFGGSNEDYPGSVRSVGVGLGWRRELYRGLNASVRAVHFLQLYDEHGRRRTTGYQLFLQARFGWRWPARASGFWIEPSVAFNWWPIEVGRPATFEANDDRWPSYFLFEPWLNLGWSW